MPERTRDSREPHSDDTPARTPVSTAEALLKAGHPQEALEYISTINPEHLENSSAARLDTLAGMSLFESGLIRSAIERLREATQRASSSEHALRFGASLALFSRESQFQSPDEALGALSKLRQLATSAGDASSLGNLHLVVARLEGFRGHCVNARRHLEIAKQLFIQLENPALNGAVDLVEAGLETFAGNLRRALQSAGQGVEGARSSGLAIPLAGSLSNLGFVNLLVGNVDTAQEILEHAVGLSQELLLVRLSAQDSLAQTALFSGDLTRCQRHLQEWELTIDSEDVPARSWSDLAHQVTRSAYFEHVEKWESIIDVADDADPELARRQYKALRTSLLCAKARALARLGKHRQADGSLAAAVRICPRGAVDPLIALEASKALCASLRGDHASGALFYDRALAACRAIGHRYHEWWIDRDRADILKHTRESVAVAPPARTVSDTSLLVSDIATIIGAGHSIDLLAHRMAAILQSTPLRDRVEIRSESGRHYRPEPSAACETSPDGTYVIRLRGSDRRVSINVRGAETLDEICLLKSMADLAQAAVSRTVDSDTEDEDLNLWPRSLVSSGEDTIFRSPRMAELLRVAERLAATNIPVLITGETGTGKEVIARLIHERSLVKRGPFVPFNCSAMPRELVESQLFGHRRGAFTGAVDSFPGVIRMAERGSLFLDEIGDLDPAAQPKLLRFLESGEIHPVGDVRTHIVGARIIAATNADLADLVEQGRFRRDLYYRIGTARIALPPLRERKDEIPALASLFLARFAKECGRTGLRLGDDLIAALLLYHWPGNIRQLANEIRRVAAMAEDGQTLGAASLDPEITAAWDARPVASSRPPAPAISIRLDQPLSQAMAELEEHFIAHAMTAAGGRVADAAQLLGLSRKGLFLKRRRRGLVEH